MGELIKLQLLYNLLFQKLLVLNQLLPSQSLPSLLKVDQMTKWLKKYKIWLYMLQVTQIVKKKLKQS